MMICPYCYGTGWVPDCFESTCVCLEPPCNRIRCTCNTGHKAHPPTAEDKRRQTKPPTAAPLLDLMAKP